MSMKALIRDLECNYQYNDHYKGWVNAPMESFKTKRGGVPMLRWRVEHLYGDRSTEAQMTARMEWLCDNHPNQWRRIETAAQAEAAIAADAEALRRV